MAQKHKPSLKQEDQKALATCLKQGKGKYRRKNYVALRGRLWAYYGQKGQVSNSAKGLEML